MKHRHNGVRIGKRKGSQEHRIHHAEDRRVRANTQSEDGERRYCEAGIFSQYANCTGKGLPEAAHRFCRDSLVHSAYQMGTAYLAIFFERLRIVEVFGIGKASPYRDNRGYARCAKSLPPALK